jgi:hypothetical protein
MRKSVDESVSFTLAYVVSQTYLYFFGAVRPKSGVVVGETPNLGHASRRWLRADRGECTEHTDTDYRAIRVSRSSAVTLKGSATMFRYGRCWARASPVRGPTGHIVPCGNLTMWS